MEEVNQLELDFFISKLTNLIALVMVVVLPLFIHVSLTHKENEL